MIDGSADREEDDILSLAAASCEGLLAFCETIYDGEDVEMFMVAVSAMLAARLKDLAVRRGMKWEVVEHRLTTLRDTIAKEMMKGPGDDDIHRN